MDFSMQRRAGAVIAQGALTNSKRPESHIKGVYPTHLVDGHGCRVLACNGKTYTDYICGLGANLLGYGYEPIAKTIREAAGEPFAMSLGTPKEVQAAEKLIEFFPFIDQVKFLKTGTEACAAAVRIARTATGRSKVLSSGYHGWSDGFVSLTPPAFGTVPCHFEQFTDLAQIDSDTACVIVEPIITKVDQDRINWLQELRKACTKHGALLIFDEVITGFRFESHGVSNAYGIIPDLICLGKTIGGGLPLAAVGGKRELMDDSRYFVSSTFAGDRLALSASLSFMESMQKHRINEAIQSTGAVFKQKFNAISPSVQIEGYNTRGVFVGDPLKKALFFQEACKAGILFGPTWFWCLPHAEHTDITISACRHILGKIDRGEVALEGEMPSSPFAQKVREQGR